MTAGRSGAGWAALVVIGAALATAPGYRTAAAPDDDVVLTLVDQDFAIAADDPWTASYTIEGTGAVLDDLATTTTVAPPASTGAPTAAPGPAAGVVTVRLHGRIGARAALQDALSGDVGPPLDELELPLDEVITVDGDEVSLALAVPTTTEPSETALTLPAPGLYPVSIEVRAGSRSLAEHATFLDRLPIEPAAAPAMGVAVLATIDDPGVAAATDQLAAAHEQLEALVELGTTADAPLSVALPPAVEPVLVEDPELADALGDALATSELLPLPARQLDPSSATAVGVADAFSRELRAGEDVLARLLPESPTRRAAWLVTAPLSAAAGGQLRDPLGFRLLVIDEATYSSLDGNIGAFLDPTLSVDVALAGGASLPATVLSPLGAELAGAGDDATTTPADAAVRVMASLVTARRELGPELRRNVALAAPGLGVPDAQTVAALAELAADSPDVTMTTLSRFVGTDTMRVDDVPVTLQLPATAGVDLSGRAQRIDLLRVAAVSAGSMTTDGAQRAEWADRLDAALSTELDADAADAALDDVATEIDAVYASVHLPEPFTFTLTGRRSMLRVNVRNDADTDRIVVVRATSSKLRFPDGDQNVTLAPGVTEVLIPVEARSNGTSSVEIQLLTPVFPQRIGPSTFLTARVNALTGLGQVITGGALVVLVTWWFSHLRRRRRAGVDTAAAEAPEDAAMDVSPDAAEATAVAHHGEAGGDHG